MVMQKFIQYSTNPPDVYGFGHLEIYRHIVDCIQTGKQLVDGLESQELRVDQSYESIETGKEVFLVFGLSTVS